MHDGIRGIRYAARKSACSTISESVPRWSNADLRYQLDCHSNTIHYHTLPYTTSGRCGVLPRSSVRSWLLWAAMAPRTWEVDTVRAQAKFLGMTGAMKGPCVHEGPSGLEDCARGVVSRAGPCTSRMVLLLVRPPQSSRPREFLSLVCGACLTRVGLVLTLLNP